MIYNELNQHDFAYELSSNKDNGFTYDGATMLFDYLEEFDNMEFDPVALRCEYSEYSKEELVKNYSYSADVENEEDKEEKENITMEYIRNNSLLLEDNTKDIYILLDF